MLSVSTYLYFDAELQEEVIKRKRLPVRDRAKDSGVVERNRSRASVYLIRRGNAYRASVQKRLSCQQVAALDVIVVNCDKFQRWEELKEPAAKPHNIRATRIALVVAQPQIYTAFGRC